MSEISTATTHDAQPESQPKVENSELNSDEKKETAPSIDVEHIPETNTIEEKDSSSDDKPLQEVVVDVEDAKNHAYNKATESIYDSSLIIDSYEFDYVVSKLREFFKGLGFLEAHPQNRLSILAACEDPFTVAQFDYAGKVWPLPQTGQMWLEYELIKNPAAKGYFCL
tara:strand:- start:145 stop:648 length:504 start_codon:yes stop_codon:yes gene_type:complete